MMEVRVEEPSAVVTCLGDVTAGESAFELRAELRALLRQHDSVVVNLEHVGKMDCAGLGSIANAVAYAIAGRKHLSIKGGHGITEEMLELSRLNGAVGPTDPEESEAARRPYEGLLPGFVIPPHSGGGGVARA
jgi:anti-anti-sigma factor